MIDPMDVGFHAPHAPRGRTAHDFLTDPETGLRPGERGVPHGWAKIDLMDGGVANVNLPPLPIWVGGEYLGTLPDDKLEKVKGMLQAIPDPQDQWDAWVVSGEGTPGNFAYRVYLLPREIASDPEPQHPMMWPEALKKSRGSIYTSPRTALPGGPMGQASFKPPPPPKPPVPKMPVGTRFRCPGCGHWFKENDLAGHSNFCCPGKAGQIEVEGIDGLLSDFAVLCECCDTLDEVAMTKPGYPRVVAKAATEADDKPDEEVKPSEEVKEEPKEPTDPDPEPVAA